MDKDFLDDYKDLYLETVEQIYIKLNYRTSRAMIIRKIDQGLLKTLPLTNDRQRYFTRYRYLVDIKSLRNHLLDQGFEATEIYTALCN